MFIAVIKKINRASTHYLCKIGSARGTTHGSVHLHHNTLMAFYFPVKCKVHHVWPMVLDDMKVVLKDTCDLWLCVCKCSVVDAALFQCQH